VFGFCVLNVLFKVIVRHLGFELPTHLVLATLTENVKFEMEMVVENGRGYVPASERIADADRFDQDKQQNVLFILSDALNYNMAKKPVFIKAAKSRSEFFANFSKVAGMKPSPAIKT